MTKIPPPIDAPMYHCCIIMTTYKCQTYLLSMTAYHCLLDHGRNKIVKLQSSW